MRARKKPVEVEVVLFDRAVAELEYGKEPKTYPMVVDLGYRTPTVFDSPNRFIIETLEGAMTVKDGDYIIKGVHGGFYPCKPDIFHETYYFNLRRVQSERD